MIIPQEHQSLPNTDRLSVLAASILLAYSFLPFIRIPERGLVVQLAGIVFEFKVNFFTIIALISAGMAATGTDWLLGDHPGLGAQPTYQHWLIPAMTTWVIGVSLSTLGVGPQWWAVFGFGGLLLVLVLISEYIVVDPYNTYHALAAAGLTAVSYALFLILTVTLVASGARLYVLLPALGVAVFLFTLRNLHLRLNGRWYFLWAGGITLIISQFVAALHYWPISPLRYGLVILGLAYALSSIAGSVEEGRAWREIWLEPVLMLVLLWGLAVILPGLNL